MSGAHFLLAIHLFALAAFAQESEPSDSTGEFWPEIDLYVKLNEKARIFGLISATRPENLKSFADGQNGVHLDFYGVPPLRKYPLVNAVDPSRSKSLLVRVGYLISRPKNDTGTSVEHMATSEATIRAHLQKELLLSVRNRADFRWVDGDPKHRYRNRIKLERTLAAGRFQLTPYAHAELFMTSTFVNGQGSDTPRVLNGPLRNESFSKPISFGRTPGGPCRSLSMLPVWLCSCTSVENLTNATANR